jgi:hypothetical protein
MPFSQKPCSFPSILGYGNLFIPLNIRIWKYNTNVFISGQKYELASRI